MLSPEEREANRRDQVERARARKNKFAQEHPEPTSPVAKQWAYRREAPEGGDQGQDEESAL
jgi:hypothetical protein